MKPNIPNALVLLCAPWLLAWTALAWSGEAPAQEPAQAPEKPSLQAELADIGKRIWSNFTEEEIDLMFDFMRDTALSALKERDVEPLPPELEFKLEILRERMIKEGNAAWQIMLRDMQRKLDKTLKELKPPPPPPPAYYDLPPLPDLPKPPPPRERT